MSAHFSQSCILHNHNHMIMENDNMHHDPTIYIIIATVLLIVITPSLIQSTLYPSRAKEKIVVKSTDDDIISDSTNNNEDINQINKEIIGDNEPVIEVKSVKLDHTVNSLEIDKQVIVATNDKKESSDSNTTDKKEIKEMRMRMHHKWMKTTL